MMGIMLSPETLRCYPLFAGLDNATLKVLAMAGEYVRIGKGEWLFYEGETADALYMLLEGAIELRIALDSAKTRHVSLCTLISGDIVGWSALVEPYIYHLSAVALADSTLARWDGVYLCELMTHNPATGYKLMSRITQVVGTRLAEFCLRFASLVEGDPWQGVEGPHSGFPSN